MYSKEYFPAGESEASPETVCKEAVLKLEAICVGGGGEESVLSKELVSNKGEKSTIAVDPALTHCPPAYREREGSSPVHVKTYQIPLDDRNRSLNQSLNYPPPPPPSPGFTLKTTLPGSPESGEVESCFVFPTVPPKAKSMEQQEDRGTCASSEKPQATKLQEPLPAKCFSANSSKEAANTTQPASAPAKEDPPPPPPPPPAAAATTAMPAMMMQAPTPVPAMQYVQPVPMAQYQPPPPQPAAPAPIIVTQQVTNTCYSVWV